MTLGKIYLATMLSMLNTRPKIRNKLGLTVVGPGAADPDSNVNGPNQGTRMSVRPIELTFTDPRGIDNLTTPGTTGRSPTSSTSGSKSENDLEYELGEVSFPRFCCWDE
ncbi:hypothetical protein D9758_009740 [Tetrapyrgos nigripes]|uniref:Uncharacterized protein n=1 Tax=Tetrapyrgos nigripes TaxID=182062 RepID=A0A8H5LQN6_9AGAR|nr:hypothetical protein D9758_009740 [Tetrapyrgos nigripes]